MEISIEEYLARTNDIIAKNSSSNKTSIKTRKQASKLEHCVQMDVISFLRKNGLFAFAIPNGGFRKKRTAIDLKKEGAISGVADICVMLPEGRTVWIEMKRNAGYGASAKTGKRIKLYAAGGQSESQKEFQNKCKELGHEYHVAYSVKDVADIFGLDAGFYALMSDVDKSVDK